MSNAPSMRNERMLEDLDNEGKYFPQDEVMVTKNNI
jgi:hypothetical protein